MAEWQNGRMAENAEW
jgi:hypothetical protein